jgi:hypothetical protein
MARMRSVLVHVTQSDSSASRLGGGGNVGQTARMDHGDIRQCGTAGRGKGCFNVGPHPLTANSCNANGCVTGLSTCATAGAGGDAAERFLQVAMSTRAAPAQAIATRGVVDIAALDVLPTKKVVAGSCGLVPGAPGRKWQPLMESPAERRRYGLTGTVSRSPSACLHWRLSRRARCDGELQAWNSSEDKR